MEGTQELGLSLIKQLASCNNGTRGKALNALLKNWLPNQTLVSDDDMKKLWKGLFYCVWHADKVAFQTQLIEFLASVIPSLDLPLAVNYFSVFLLTMRREWTGIDGLRLDKFYLLIRRFLRCYFLLMKKNSWDVELVKKLMGVLADRSLLSDDKFHGNGVNYHIVSVFVEEIRAFLPLREEVVEEIFGSFISVMGRAQDKVLVGKIRSNVLGVLLKMGRRLLEVKKSENDVESGNEVLLLGTIALAMGFSRKFFELGSSVECCQGNRKVLFSLHEEFLKLEKDLGSSGIDVVIPDVSVVDGGEEEEVPDLVPISDEVGSDDSGDDVVEGAADKVLKECKNTDASGGNGVKDKKCKKKKKKHAVNGVDTATCFSGKEDDNIVSDTSTGSTDERNDDTNLISFNESVISNLRTQFEKIAAEVGMEDNVESACDLPQVSSDGTNCTASKKRNRVKTKNLDSTKKGDAEGRLTAETEEKSAKKVRFSMKNNLVWKPQSPMPPQSLRIPPSVAPRGSALKKGVPPGPIREIPVASKKVKQRAKSVKKARKLTKIKNPALKAAKKLKSLSP